MAMRNNFNFFDANKNWYPSTLWGINVKIPIYNSGEGAAKNKQKELELLKAKNELIDIENQIISLFAFLENNNKNALSSYNDQKIKVDLIETVYNNEEKKVVLWRVQLLNYFSKKNAAFTVKASFNSKGI